MEIAPDVVQKLLEAGLGWIWIVVLALWGGTVNYISRTKKENLKFSVIEWIGELTISSFAGVVTGLICMHYQVPLYLTFAIVALSGHAGGRAIHMLERYVYNKWFKGNK